MSKRGKRKCNRLGDFFRFRLFALCAPYCLIFFAAILPRRLKENKERKEIAKSKIRNALPPFQHLHFRDELRWKGIVIKVIWIVADGSHFGEGLVVVAIF
jgi:hypothetical protein